jgi:hypothetical protein
MSSSPKQSRIISKILAPAIRLWLRSQADSIHALELEIEAGDREILAGRVARVSVAAERAVYRGLHLSQVVLAAEMIQINLGEVFKGKPLKLLAIVPVAGEVLLHQSDLQVSCQSALMQTAVAELLQRLLPIAAAEMPSELGAGRQISREELHDLQIDLGQNNLTLRAALLTTDGASFPLVIRTGLQLASAQQLQFKQPELLPHPQASQGQPLSLLDNFVIDLGEEVQLKTLVLSPERMICQGQINVLP